MQTFFGALLGVFLGFIIGVVAGKFFAYSVFPPPPGHALDGLGLLFAIMIGCTIGGGIVGGVLVARNNQSDRPSPPT